MPQSGNLHVCRAFAQRREIRQSLAAAIHRPDANSDSIKSALQPALSIIRQTDADIVRPVGDAPWLWPAWILADHLSERISPAGVGWTFVAMASMRHQHVERLLGRYRNHCSARPFGILGSSSRVPCPCNEARARSGRLLTRRICRRSPLSPRSRMGNPHLVVALWHDAGHEAIHNMHRPGQR